jgi:hypothetical protein
MSDERADFPSGCVESLRSGATTATTYRASTASWLTPRTPRPARLLGRLLDDHRVSLDGGVPARQTRDLSAGGDVVGRLAGADELPAAERRPGKSALRDLLRHDPHEVELNAKPGPCE